MLVVFTREDKGRNCTLSIEFRVHTLSCIKGMFWKRIGSTVGRGNNSTLVSGSTIPVHFMYATLHVTEASYVQFALRLKDLGILTYHPNLLINSTMNLFGLGLSHLTCDDKKK